jgi:hypothetical protein
MSAAKLSRCSLDVLPMPLFAAVGAQGIVYVVEQTLDRRRTLPAELLPSS